MDTRLDCCVRRSAALRNQYIMVCAHIASIQHRKAQHIEHNENLLKSYPILVKPKHSSEQENKRNDCSNNGAPYKSALKSNFYSP